MKTISIYFWDLNEGTQEDILRAYGVETNEEFYALTNYDVLPITEIYVESDKEPKPWYEVESECSDDNMIKTCYLLGEKFEEDADAAHRWLNASNEDRLRMINEWQAEKTAKSKEVI